MRRLQQNMENRKLFFSTGSTFYNKSKQSLSVHEMNSYSPITFSLMNQITDSETQKNYYRTRLTEQFYTHHNQLESAFYQISQKNSVIVELEEQLDRMNKNYRLLSDDYLALKCEIQSLKNIHLTQITTINKNHEQQITKIQKESLIKSQLQINTKIQQIQAQCQKRIQTFKNQLQQARANSNQLLHQLKLLREEYHQIMLKNQTIIQESINRELKKSDFETQQNQLTNIAEYEHLKKLNQELRDKMNEQTTHLQQLETQNKKLKAENITLNTKLKDIEQAFQQQKTNNRVSLEQKFKTTSEIQTNTEQQYLPLILPVETNLVGQLKALQEFMTQKIISKFEDFFTKASLKEKKKSASFITFKNFLAEDCKNSTENKILLQVHTGMQRIVKLYCPNLNYSRQFLTVKDEFILKTLMECEGLSNKQQKLFRLLELIHRLHHPITHVKSQISRGELKMVEIKVIGTLKKIFSGG